ncbi:PadR family transcriptional regulator [Saccharothrix saharensis]|uniref:PadR family transcriptional regulator n=1 Tax=Saccharothrix saharensis TaxID=571190 RepID=UPI001B87B4BE|nr:PadR family transcriptional regulator [Saccharothrix saharensis]
MLAAVLANHARGEETYGSAVSTERGMYPATVIPILHRIEVLGWLTSRVESDDEWPGDRPRRRYYRPVPGYDARIRDALAEADRRRPLPTLAPLPAKRRTNPG